MVRALSRARAIGMHTARIATLQMMDIRTGFCDGTLSLKAAGFGLPNSSRNAPATADTGFHSAMGCIQPGSPWVGTIALDTKAIGNSTRRPMPWADSGSLTDKPTHAISQLIA